MSILDGVSAVFGGDKPEKVSNLSRGRFKEKNETAAKRVALIASTGDQHGGASAYSDASGNGAPS